MKTLKITWLDTCPDCDEIPHTLVTTEKGYGLWLYDGDIATCPLCNKNGVIECDENIAFVVWEPDEPA